LIDSITVEEDSPGSEDHEVRVAFDL
jgi:hypothetical protein